MSLIEDALRKRRQEEEGAGASPPSPSEAAGDQHTDSPVMPPPLPPAPESGDTGAEKNRRQLRLAGIVVAVVVVAALAGWLAIFAFKQWKRTQEITQNQTALQRTPAAAATNQTAAAAVEPVKAAVTSAPVSAVAVTSAPPAGTAAALSNAVVKPHGSAPDAAKIPPAAPEHRKAEATDTGFQTGAVKELSATTTSAVAEAAALWPSLHLSGILDTRTAGRGSAIINKQIVGSGETVEGVTVVEIRKGEVVLEYQKERRTIKTGGATP